MNQQIIDKFSELQDRACGYTDKGEMTAEEFAKTYPTTKEMVAEAKYWLEMFYGTGRGIGCISAEMRFSDDVRERREWRSIVASIKRFIAKLEKEEQ